MTMRAKATVTAHPAAAAAIGARWRMAKMRLLPATAAGKGDVLRKILLVTLRRQPAKPASKGDVFGKQLLVEARRQPATLATRVARRSECMLVHMGLASAAALLKCSSAQSRYRRWRWMRRY